MIRGKGPGDYLTRNNRFAAMLEQDAGKPSDIKSHTQGLAYLLNQGLAGWAMGKDDKERKEANAAITGAMKEDTITTPGEVDDMSAEGDEDYQPEDVTTADPNGRTLKERLTAALGSLKDNAYGQQYTMGMVPGMMAQEQAAATLKSKYAHEAEVARQLQTDKLALKGAPGSTTGDNAPKYGNTPIWGRDADGNDVLMQPSSAGGVRQAQMPEGVTPIRSKVSTKDMGDRFAHFDANGQLVGYTPKKQLGPSQTPDHARLSAAAGESGQQAVKASGKAFDSLDKTNANIANIDDAISAIDNGAQTGAINSFLPSVRAASVELDNIQQRMGLDVIGNVTFGALSKGELDLALNTALPTKLGPVELRKWLVAKKSAQGKLSKYLSEAAIYLGTPGNTIASWATVRNRRGGAPAASAPAAGRIRFDAKGNPIP